MINLAIPILSSVIVNKISSTEGGGTDTGAMVTKDPKAPKAEKADAGLLVAIEPTKKQKRKTTVGLKNVFLDWWLVYTTHVCMYNIYLYVNIYLFIYLACIFDSVMAMFCLSIGVCFEYVQHSRSLVNGHDRKTNSSRNQISALQWLSSVSQRLRDSRFDLPSSKG